MGVTSSGSIFAITNNKVLRSRDNGTSWAIVHDYSRTSGESSLPAAPTSLDPWLWVDPISNRIFVDHLTLACTTVTWSDDDGDTWAPELPTACGSPLADFQKLVTGPPGPVANSKTGAFPSVAYLCYNKPVFEPTGLVPAGSYGTACASSYDGGTVWENEAMLTRTVWVNGQQVMGTCDGGAWAPAVALDGTVVVRAQADCMFRSRDSGATWESIGKGPPFQGTEFAFDDNGTLYALSAEWDPPLRLSISHDQGTTWSEPVVVQPPQLHGPNFAAFSAGSSGRLFIGFWATLDNITTSDQASDTARYDAWLLAVTDADTAHPNVVATNATPADSPMYIGNPTRGRSSPFLGDFVTTAVGPHGTPYIVFPDSCNVGCEGNPHASTADMTPGTTVVSLDDWKIRDGPRPQPKA